MGGRFRPSIVHDDTDGSTWAGAGPRDVATARSAFRVGAKFALATTFHKRSDQVEHIVN